MAGEHDDHANEAKRRLKKRITEDDPRWNPKTMGNKRGKKRGVRPDFREYRPVRKTNI